MTYENIVATVADSLGLPKEVVDKTYKAYWKAIRQHIKSLPLKDNISDEDFLKLKTSVNIPSIGKLYIPLEKYQKSKERHQYILEHYAKDKKN